MIVFAQHSAFFAAPYLTEAFYGGVLYVHDTKYNNFFKTKTISGLYCGVNTENIPKSDCITIIGHFALKMISHRIERGDFKYVNLILCDTDATVSYNWWNGFVERFRTK